MNEDLVIKKLITLEEDVAVIKEKAAKLDMFDTLLTGQDKMIKILDRLDQERIFTNEKINQLEADIQRIKLQLNMA